MTHREERPDERRQRGPAQRRVVRAPRSGRVPAPLVAEVDGCERRDVSRAAADRDLQQLERARQLQRASARPGGVGEAGCAAGRRVPARVPRALARRVADEADDDAVPQPDGDGRRGVDPRLSAGRRRPADGLRQDQPGEHHGRGQRGHPVDRGHRRADAERALAGSRDRLLQRLLALPRGAARRAHHRGRLGGDRECDVALERPLHDDGHRLDDGLCDGGARPDAARRGGDPRRGLAPQSPGGGGGTSDRGARRRGADAVADPHPRGVRERDSRAARHLRVDQRDPASHRLRGPRRGGAAAAALRRPRRLDALARRPEARRPAPDGGLLLRRRSAGRDGADRRPAAHGRDHRHRQDGGGQHRGCRDREPRRDPAARRSRSGRSARSSCCVATCARAAR